MTQWPCAQWRHWFAVERAWLDRSRIPFWHTTVNHTAFDPASEAIFTAVMADLPQNGPEGQAGLGGEGYFKTEWLDATLDAHSDARRKLVVGHHPA